MHRYIRGLMLAAAAGVVWGCGDDPLAEGAGDNLDLTGDPAALFVNVGELERMVVELIDDQGTAVQTTFAVSNVSAGITVEVDESFVPVFSPEGELLPPTSPTRVRLEVTAGLAAGVETFDVTAEGVTKTFTVRVVPTGFVATFAEPPIVLDTVTMTATAPFGFAPDAVIISATGWEYETIEVAADGSSITFIPSTSEPGPLTVQGATLSFIAGATFTFETVNADGIGSPFTNQTDPDATAPTIAAPAAVGDSVVFIDGATIAVDQFYRVSVPAAGTYQFTLSWDSDADEDMLLCNADCSAFLPGGTAGATGANPENATIVAAGAVEWVVWINLYDAHDDPAPNFKIVLKRTL